MIPLRDRNPSGSFPAVTLLIIVACTVVFFFELAAGREIKHLFYAFALIPGRVTEDLQAGSPGWSGAIAPFFTSMFLHGGWLHLIGNMWFLWIFGDNVEDTLGPLRFLFFYLICGFAAGIAHYLADPNSMLPSAGASGAIAGVLAGYVVLFPGARVLTLVPLGFFLQVMELPAFIVLGIWFVIQALSGFLSIGVSTGGVAWWAHVGGFLAGLILVRPLRPRRVMA
jgi:membrane associated rhomboid family serine protease